MASHLWSHQLVFFCPDVNLTYTCHDDQVDHMSWSAKPYFTENDILYSPGLIYVNNESVVFIEGTNNNFISSLMTIVYNSDNIDVANITTTLTVITRGLGNGTNITCLTYRRVEKSQSFSTLYIAGTYIIGRMCMEYAQSISDVYTSLD